ncbi:serine/threonine-protein phosphatase [Streptomyces sp. SID11385]|nr:serine/threonine-protein phosphatase [Streptomyces sp. SID11385]
MRGALRAYAVLQGEDPAAVLADLELVLRLSEPGRSATALYAHLGQDGRRLRFAGAGHAPPLLIGPRRVEYLESTVSAPLTMLSCWEAPSVEVRPEPGESLVLYTDGLLRATGDTADRAFARLHAAAASSPLRLRRDPGALADHVLGRVLPERALPTGEDLALLALTFD